MGINDNPQLVEYGITKRKLLVDLLELTDNYNRFVELFGVFIVGEQIEKREKELKIVRCKETKLFNKLCGEEIDRRVKELTKN